MNGVRARWASNKVQLSQCGVRGAPLPHDGPPKQSFRHRGRFEGDVAPQSGLEAPTLIAEQSRKDCQVGMDDFENCWDRYLRDPHLAMETYSERSNQMENKNRNQAANHQKGNQ